MLFPDTWYYEKETGYNKQVSEDVVALKKLVKLAELILVILIELVELVKLMKLSPIQLKAARTKKTTYR